MKNWCGFKVKKDKLLIRLLKEGCNKSRCTSKACAAVQDTTALSIIIQYNSSLRELARACQRAGKGLPGLARASPILAKVASTIFGGGKSAVDGSEWFLLFGDHPEQKIGKWRGGSGGHRVAGPKLDLAPREAESWEINWKLST